MREKKVENKRKLLKGSNLADSKIVKCQGKKLFKKNEKKARGIL
jgi:hypothetical protein